VKLYSPALLFAALCGASTVCASTITYQFTINTTTLNGQAGNLDFQLNPGNISASFVALDLSGLDLHGGSFVASQIQLTGAASGTFATDVLLNNSQGYNDAFQPVDFGTSVTFFATFSGTGVDNPASPGSVFGFSIFDSAGTTALLTTSADGTIAGVTVDTNGVETYTNPATVGGGSAATVAAVATVPEPGTVFSALVGLGVCAARIRAKRCYRRNY
jgi:hypothetical protein